MDTEKDLSVRSVVTESFRFFASNIKSISILCLPILFFLSTVCVATEAWGGYYLLICGGFSILLSPIIISNLILFTAKRTFNQDIDYRSILWESMTIWWPVFQVILFTVAAAFLGFLFLIVPGIWIAVRLSFSLFYTIVVRLNPNASVKQSFFATKEPFWVIFWSTMVFIVPIAFVETALEASINSLGSVGILNIVLSTVAGFIDLIVTVVLFRVFMLTALHKNGGTTA